MHIDKAIEINGETIRYQYSASQTPEAIAFKMAHSALVTVRFWRDQGYPECEPLLTGETQEQEPCR